MAYTERLPVVPGGYESSLTGVLNRKDVIAQAHQIIENIEQLSDGIISQCAMQSKMGAKAIKDRAVYYCPEKTGALKGTGKYYAVNVMDARVAEEFVWPSGVGAGNFTFTQKQQAVWEVSFGGGEVDYAAVIHENEFVWRIHTEINENARDHYLLDAYNEHKDYFSRRIMDRVKAQIMRAGIRAATRTSVEVGPVYTDEVPF